MKAEAKMFDDLCRRIDAEIKDPTDPAMMDRFDAVIQTQSALLADRTERPYRRILLVAAAIAVVVVPLAVILKVQLAETAIPFWLDSTSGTFGNIGDAVSTGKGEKRTISFENGSKMTLQEDTSLIVAKSSDEAVELEMTRGELYLNVEGEESANWSVKMGQYRVSVLGTRFWVSWDDEVRRLDVRVENGAVLTEGTTLGARGVVVQKGKHLRVDEAGEFLTMASVDSSRYDPDSQNLLKEDSEEEHSLDAKDSTQQKSATTGESENDTKTFESRLKNKGLKYFNENGLGKFRTNLKKRDARKAVATADAAGFSTLSGRMTLDELWNFMNMARKTGRYDLAEACLLECRKRFKGSQKAQLAPFVLGKLHYYGTEDLASASKWFRTYLSENPGGTLTEEARGRLILILVDQGKSAAAINAARQYLRDYPTGVFSDTCRKLVEK